MSALTTVVQPFFPLILHLCRTHLYAIVKRHCYVRFVFLPKIILFFGPEIVICIRLQLSGIKRLEFGIKSLIECE